MKIIEMLKSIGESIGGFLIFIVIIAVIFGIVYLIRIPFALTSFSALEALPEAEKIAKEKYPDAQLTRVEAYTGSIESYTSEYGKTIEIRTKFNKNPKPLHSDGTAEEWYFSFYSPSEKLKIIKVNIVKRKSSKKIVGDISTSEIKLPFAERVGHSREEIEKKEKEIQERWEGAIFDPKNWKIDSTEAMEIIKDKVSGEFSIDELVLVGRETLTWVASSAELKKSTEGQQWVWEIIAEVNAVSGEVID